MNEQNTVHIDDEMRELWNTWKMCAQMLNHLQQLKNHNVEWLDKDSYEPVVPDNVLMFPSNRRLQ